MAGDGKVGGCWRDGWALAGGRAETARGKDTWCRTPDIEQILASHMHGKHRNTNKRPIVQKTFDNGGIVRSATSCGVSETFIDRWYGRVLMRTNVYREGVMVCGCLWSLLSAPWHPLVIPPPRNASDRTPREAQPLGTGSNIRKC